MDSVNELELGQAQLTVPSDQRQILCLSGGGYRGLYTCLLLEALEAKAKRPLADVFDVLAGTSIGGLIAAGLSLRIPAAQLRKSIQEHGPSIFDRRIGWGKLRLNISNPLRHLYRSKYDQRPLRNAIDDIFGDDARLMSDIDTPLLLTAVSTKTGTPVLMKSKGLAGQTSSDLSLKDALLATSAAPTYFPPHHSNSETYVDGGLIANAPDMVAVTETMRNLGCDVNDVRVLSVGTASSSHEIPKAGTAPGLLSWLVARGLVQLTLSAQEALAVDQCSVLLGDRYLRLNRVPNLAEQDKVGLDQADKEASAILKRCAEESIELFTSDHKTELRRFLSHTTLGPRKGPLG